MIIRNPIYKPEYWSGALKSKTTLAFSVLAMGSGTAAAQSSNSSFEHNLAPVEQAASDAKLGIRNGSVIVAPVPFSNPMIGSGLAVGAGYLFQTDSGSDTSSLGAGYLRSDNDTEGAAVTFNLSFSDNKWGISGLYADADLNYDLISPSGSIPLTQSGKLAKLELSYGITSDFSIGLVSRYLETTVSSADPLFQNLPDEFQPPNDFTVFSYGFLVSYDRSDNDLYPTSGSRLKVVATQNEPSTSGAQDYAKGYLTYDRYLPVGAEEVFALRVAACSASNDAPFFDQCSVGGTDAFRGFNVTEFLDSAMASLQVEYRGRFSKRLGYVVFGGTGAVGNGFKNLSDSGSAAGIGLRYRVSKKFPVDFAVDGSMNDEGEELLYISVGQRF